MTTQTSPYTGRPIVDWYDEHYTLRDVDGDKIGDIVEVNPDFVIAESDGGFLGLGERRTYYVPRSAITQSETADWYLNIDKDNIENMGWVNPPTGSTWTTNDWQTQYGYTDDKAAHEGAMRMIRYEEDLQPQTVQRQAGEVTVTKNVVEETKTIEVPVRREEVHVERRPVTESAASSTDQAAFTREGQTIRVPVMEEEVQVNKVARPVEEVVVTKTGTEDTRQVSDTVRKEQFDIQGADQPTSGNTA
jgi:uncharacterized protein (TIGR02271 family)